MKAKIFLAITLLLGFGLSVTAQHYEYDLKVVIEKTNSTQITAEKFNEGILKLAFNDITLTPKIGATTTVVFEELKNISFQDIYDPGYVSINAIAALSLKAYVPQGSNTLIIENDQPIGGIAIVSLTGQTLVKTSLSGTSANVDVSRLPQGIFILKVGNNTLKLRK